MTKVCKICNCNDGSVLFDVPKDEKRRKTWSEACNVPLLPPSSQICAKHFQLQDIINNNRLKRNAMPFKTIPAGLGIKVKEEPDISFEEDTDEIIQDPLLVVKLENPDQSDLIHEENFDENNESIAVQRPLSPSVGTDDKHMICGHLIVQLENEQFKLRCKYCAAEFEIIECEAFVEHMKQAHADVIDNKKSQIVKLTKTDDASATNKGAENMKLEFDDYQMENDLQQSDESMDTDENYEPDKKLAQQASKKDNYDSKISNDTKRRQRATKKDQENLITFDTVPQQYVLTFLELIKSNAILWHRRQSIMKRFDETLNEVLISFNKAHPKYQLTDESARQSINRIKELYQRVTDVNHKRYLKLSTHKTKFPAFFEQCSAIEENSRKIVFSCNKCLSFFFTEIDLQIHQVKRHRIGELPFKCQRCNYGFTSAEKRDEHEAKHQRARDFVCEICNRGFNAEEKLHVHSKIHANDLKPVCEKCGQIFSTYNKYRRHKLRHEDPKEKCHICGKLFFEKWNLSEHIKSHLNERSYNCDICDKSFNHQNDVTIHKRGVHGIKPERRRGRWVNKSELTAADGYDSQDEE